MSEDNTFTMGVVVGLVLMVLISGFVFLAISSDSNSETVYRGEPKQFEKSHVEPNLFFDNNGQQIAVIDLRDYDYVEEDRLNYGEARNYELRIVDKDGELIGADTLCIEYQIRDAGIRDISEIQYIREITLISKDSKIKCYFLPEEIKEKYEKKEFNFWVNQYDDRVDNSTIKFHLSDQR